MLQRQEKNTERRGVRGGDKQSWGGVGGGLATINQVPD